MNKTFQADRGEPSTTMWKLCRETSFDQLNAAAVEAVLEHIHRPRTASERQPAGVTVSAFGSSI